MSFGPSYCSKCTRVTWINMGKCELQSDYKKVVQNFPNLILFLCIHVTYASLLNIILETMYLHIALLAATYFIATSARPNITPKLLTSSGDCRN
jgi:competence transcription factor ComK